MYARAYIGAEHDATDHKCYLSKIEPLHGNCVRSTTPEASRTIDLQDILSIHSGSPALRFPFASHSANLTACPVQNPQPSLARCLIWSLRQTTRSS